MLFLLLAAVCMYVILRDLDRSTPKLAARAVAAAVLIVALVSVPTGARADSDKVLQNVKGSVSYQTPAGKSTAIAPSANAIIADQNTAITGTDSIGKIQLPDSSVVTLASQTKVELAFFNQTDIANAQFVVYQGKTRFKVEHPQGAKANYTFKTPTSQLAVRGTEGDIGIDGDNLTVNVYQASEPVQITFKDGKIVTVNAGQQLIANLVNGIIQTQVSALTQAAIDKFNELGVPTNMDQLKSTILNKVNLPSIPRVRLPF